MTYKSKLPKVYNDLLTCVVSTKSRSIFRNQVKFLYDKLCSSKDLYAVALEMGFRDDQEVHQQHVTYWRNELRSYVSNIIKHVHSHVSFIAILVEDETNGDEDED